MKALAAMSLNRAIGYNNSIPWKIPEDMGHFRKKTLHSKLVMGRRTFYSIGGHELDQRYIFVLTENENKLKNPPFYDYEYISPQSFLGKVQSGEIDTNNLWVCGGAKTYEFLLPHCSHVYLTIVLDEYEGDVYMPPFEHLFPYSEILVEKKKFWVVRYSKHERINANIGRLVM